MWVAVGGQWRNGGGIGEGGCIAHSSLSQHLNIVPVKEKTLDGVQIQSDSIDCCDEEAEEAQ